MGSCEEKDIAARVQTRVIGHFPGERNQMIIDAGFLALSEQGYQALGGTYAIIKVHKVNFHQNPIEYAFLDILNYYLGKFTTKSFEDDSGNWIYRTFR